MVPNWYLLLAPVILIGVSRAWADDWMSEREGPGPGSGSGCLLAVPFALLGASYVAYRAWGVPDVGPQSGAAPTGARSSRPARTPSRSTAGRWP